MVRHLATALTAIAAVGASLMVTGDANARHRSGGSNGSYGSDGGEGSCGSNGGGGRLFGGRLFGGSNGGEGCYGGSGSNGGGGSLGGLFQRHRDNGGSGGGYGSNGGHGSNGGCGSSGGAYQGAHESHASDQASEPAEHTSQSQSSEMRHYAPSNDAAPATPREEASASPPNGIESRETQAAPPVPSPALPESAPAGEARGNPNGTATPATP